MPARALATRVIDSRCTNIKKNIVDLPTPVDGAAIIYGKCLCHPDTDSSLATRANRSLDAGMFADPTLAGVFYDGNAVTISGFQLEALVLEPPALLPVTGQKMLLNLCRVSVPIAAKFPMLSGKSFKFVVMPKYSMYLLYNCCPRSIASKLFLNINLNNSILYL